MLTTDKLPERPSTPSLQFNALIENQITTVVIPRFNQNGISKTLEVNGSHIVDGFILNNTNAATTANAKSHRPSVISLSPPKWSSIRPIIDAMIRRGSME